MRVPLTMKCAPVLKRETPTTAPSVGAVSRDTSVCNWKAIHQIWVHAHFLKIVLCRHENTGTRVLFQKFVSAS